MINELTKLSSAEKKNTFELDGNRKNPRLDMILGPYLQKFGVPVKTDDFEVIVRNDSKKYMVLTAQRPDSNMWIGVASLDLSSYCTHEELIQYGFLVFKGLRAHNFDYPTFSRKDYFYFIEAR